ncbi:MAG: D-glycero-beta-D-manno-heptose-7-phosphate kinase [Desulfobacteraceae bacterium]|nr:D-glycero-beta-D-manno-heptose-7-phosphate kinase [Desulfobacteraceae bacterium]
MTLNIEQFKNVKALVIGDLMIDEYLWGSVERISPEAPVPVVAVEKESHALGGSGNVINNLVAMGTDVTTIGTAGTGKAGKMIFEKLEDLGVKTDCIISEPDRPTTRKTRVIASNQQVLRIDKEISRKVSDTTFDKLIKMVDKTIPQVDLVILSDYAKGIICKDLVNHVVNISKQHDVLTVADPKSLDFSKYQHVSLLTPNKKEAALASQMDIQTMEDLFAAGKKIIRQVNLEKLLITCGKDGMVLFEGNTPPLVIESKARQVFDVSGAGDTVISILGLGLAVGATFEQSAIVANAAAGVVVGKVGTATASIKELSDALSKTSK